MTSSSSEARLLMFDVESGGHHAEYVRHLVQTAAFQDAAGAVVLAVPQEMLDAHPELGASGVETAPLAAPHPPENPWATSRRQWAQLQEVVEEHRPSAVLLLYADAVLPSLSTHARLPGAPRLASIHFRPPVRQDRRGARDRVRDLIKQRHLRRSLDHPDLRVAFSLDPRVVAALGARARHARVLPLPDPVPPPSLTVAERDEARTALRAEFGLSPDRHLMVLFGALAARKGIFAVLEAVRRLPAHAASRLAVAFVGPVVPEDEAAFAQSMREVQASTECEVVLRPGFVKEERRIEAVLGAADTVLLPYQRHIGSSAVLIRAAALQRPSLCQDYGLVGEWTSEHRLGRTADTTNPEALARALEDAIADPQGPFDPDAARAFAASHTPAAFASTIAEGLRAALR